MSENEDKIQMDIEEQLHSLICGLLGEHERSEVLHQVANDENVRRQLDEMLKVQTACRIACGLESADAMYSSLQTVLDERRRLAGRSQVISAAGFFGRHRTVVRWVGNVAAMLVVAVAASFLAVRYAGQQQSSPVASVDGKSNVAALSSQEIAQLRELWATVSAGDKAKTWVMMSEGNGEFGYMPASGASTATVANASGAQKMLLFHCVLTDASGKSLKTVNLLVPAQNEGSLSLPAAICLDDRQVNFDITTTGQKWARVGFTVGDDPKLSTGVYGTAAIGGDVSEVGRFNHNGQDMHVMVKVIPMDVNAG